MRTKVVFISNLFLLTFAFESKIVTTSYGKIKGAVQLSNDENHKYMFKSVPFAKPPVGDLRFELPQNPDPWDGVLDGTKYSAACLSNVTKTRFRQTELSEDCLYINIFTNEKCLKEKCPVIIYIHGGAFFVDSAVMFPDDFILERYVGEDVVFAIPAYRLGALGQLYFGPSVYLHENLLAFDVQKALHYVHEEIEHFGGNPKRVTLMGHSVGGTVVDVMGFSKLVDPNAVLFQQMITFSSHGQFGYQEVAINSSYELARRLGCISNENIVKRSSDDVPEILKCLRKFESLEILKTQSSLMSETNLNFNSIIRGAPFMELDGKISDLKMNPPARNKICGTTKSEFAIDRYKMKADGFFLDLENPHEIHDFYYNEFPNKTKNWIDPLSAGVYISARTYCEAMVSVGADAYLYETRQKPISVHVSDTQYFIGIHREDNHTIDMDILDSFYSKMLVNFTKTGVPSPKWEKLDPNRMNYMELKIDSELHEGPRMLERFHDEEMEVWAGPVAEYDRNVTKMKKENQSSEEKSPKLEASVSVFQQWWLYFLIILVAFFLGVLFYNLRKRRNGERTPLLA